MLLNKVCRSMKFPKGGHLGISKFQKGGHLEFFKKAAILDFQNSKKAAILDFFKYCLDPKMLLNKVVDL